MLSKKIESALNEQVLLEMASSQYYLAMASWAENVGLSGVAQFLYLHSDEERVHAIKLVKYINERGGHGTVPSLKQPEKEYKSLKAVFDTVLKHEIMVSSEINKLVEICLKEKDYTTHNFLQWYVSEQIEEERLSKDNVDKLKLIGDDKGGLYLFDRDMMSRAKESPKEK
jgi:ferritin